MRILLCDSRPTPEPTLLWEIIQHNVLNAVGDYEFSVVIPPSHKHAIPVIAFEDLDDALAATQPDIVVVVGTMDRLQTARQIAQKHGSIEVIGITHVGWVMMDFDPAKLAAMLQALVEAQRAKRARKLSISNGTRALKVDV